MPRLVEVHCPVSHRHSRNLLHEPYLIISYSRTDRDKNRSLQRAQEAEKRKLLTVHRSNYS